VASSLAVWGRPPGVQGDFAAGAYCRLIATLLRNGVYLVDDAANSFELLR